LPYLIFYGSFRLVLINKNNFMVTEYTAAEMEQESRVDKLRQAKSSAEDSDWEALMADLTDYETMRGEQSASKTEVDLTLEIHKLVNDTILPQSNETTGQLPDGLEPIIEKAQSVFQNALFSQKSK
jgi:hypothetical protein